MTEPRREQRKWDAWGYTPPRHLRSSLKEEQAELLEALQSEFDPNVGERVSPCRIQVCLELLAHLARGLESDIARMQ